MINRRYSRRDSGFAMLFTQIVQLAGWLSSGFEIIGETTSHIKQSS